jgi:hypothetical protein
MAYARKGEHGSDIYLYRATDGEWRCVECPLWENQDEILPTIGAVGAHVLLHKEAGHHIPERCLTRVAMELLGEHVETDVEKAMKEQW